MLKCKFNSKAQKKNKIIIYCQIINLVLLFVLITICSCAKKEVLKNNNKEINSEKFKVEESIETKQVIETSEVENVEEEVFVDSDKCIELAKNFYTEYIEAINNYDDNSEETVENVKNKYMTSLLIEELEYRSRKSGADAIIAAQDPVDMLEIMKVEKGEKNNTAVVKFEKEYKDGSASYREMKLHFRNVDSNILIDAIDTVSMERDKKGEEIKYEDKTKYANKKQLTEEDKLELESIKKHYEEMDELGYID